ncbi:MAG TPA: hypothetical protein VGI46_21435 [Candidatus Acidoferrum sp.]|jgi:hypothetical protein
MKTSKIQLTSLFLLAMLSPICLAQDKPKADDRAKAEVQTTPIKVQIVFTELDGDKKVKTLPYSMYINAPDANEIKPGWVKFRIGSRLPIYVGKNEMQYVDVGTNVDARSAYTGDGHVLLQMTLERSWVEGEVSFPMTKGDCSQLDSSAGHFQEPIIRGYKSELDLKLREGQPVESTVMTDPISGKLEKVEISFTVLK